MRVASEFRRRRRRRREESLGALESEIVRCRACPRLVAWRERVARVPACQPDAAFLHRAERRLQRRHPVLDSFQIYLNPVQLRLFISNFVLAQLRCRFRRFLLSRFLFFIAGIISFVTFIETWPGNKR